MESRLPFRTEIAPGDVTRHPSHRRCFLALAGVGGVRRSQGEWALWEEAVSVGEEDLALLVIPRIVRAGENGEARVGEGAGEARIILPQATTRMPNGAVEAQRRRRENLLRKLLEQAVAHAEREGVFWTPWLDVLGLECSQIRRDPIVRGEIEPRLVAQAEKLADWVASREKEEEIEELLRAYSSPEIYRLVARNTGIFSESLVSRLSPGHAHALFRNPRATPDLKEKLLLWAWKQWASGASSRPSPERTLLQDWLRMEGGFPSFLRAEMRETAKSLSGETRIEVWLLLLQDPGIEKSILRELVQERGESPKVLARAFLHPLLPADLISFLLHPPREKQQLLRRTSEEILLTPSSVAHVSEEILWAALRCYVQFRERGERGGGAPIAHALQKEAATREMWEWALAQLPSHSISQRELLDVLRSDPKVWESSIYRAAVVATEDSQYLEAVIPVEPAEAYQEILIALWDISREAVYRVLRERGVPRGVSLPLDMRREMLQSSSTENRMGIIAALPSLSGETTNAPEFVGFNERQQERSEVSVANGTFFTRMVSMLRVRMGAD